MGNSLICPDCGKQFDVLFLNERGEDMLPDILKFNPLLKIVCTECGTLLEKFYDAQRLARRLNARFYRNFNR